MKTIRQMIIEFIRDTGEAILVNDEMAVNFLDSGETIALVDLGYNHEYGFFQLSLFPGVKNECIEDKNEK